MANVRVIKAKKHKGDPPGEITRAQRETRLMAVRGANRLPATSRVTLLYAMLYDSDSRVRNLAQETLPDISPDDIAVFIAEAGHPKVLDFIARGLPNDSPTLEAIARAPNLSKRTLDYFTSIGLSSVVDNESETDAVEQGDQISSKSKGPEDSLEWSPSHDFELPEGVEFKMPTEDDSHKDDTVPSIRGFPKPETLKESLPAFDIKEKQSVEATPPEIETEEITRDRAETPASELVDELEFEMETAHDRAETIEELAKQEPPTARDRAEIPEPQVSETREPEASEETDEISTEIGAETIKPEPTTTSDSTSTSHGKGLFPVHGTTPEAPLQEEEPAAPSARAHAGDREQEAPPEKERSIRGELLRGILLGLLIGLALAAAYIAVDRLAPNWLNWFDKLKSKASESTLHDARPVSPPHVYSLEPDSARACGAVGAQIAMLFPETCESSRTPGYEGFRTRKVN